MIYRLVTVRGSNYQSLDNEERRIKLYTMATSKIKNNQLLLISDKNKFDLQQRVVGVQSLTSASTPPHGGLKHDRLRTLRPRVLSSPQVALHTDQGPHSDSTPVLPTAVKIAFTILAILKIHYFVRSDHSST